MGGIIWINPRNASLNQKHCFDFPLLLFWVLGAEISSFFPSRKRKYEHDQIQGDCCLNLQDGIIIALIKKEEDTLQARETLSDRTLGLMQLCFAIAEGFASVCISVTHLPMSSFPSCSPIPGSFSLMVIFGFNLSRSKASIPLGSLWERHGFLKALNWSFTPTCFLLLSLWLEMITVWLWAILLLKFADGWLCPISQ